MSSKPKSTKYVGEPYETLLVLQKKYFRFKSLENYQKGIESPDPAKNLHKGLKYQISSNFSKNNI